MLNRSKPKLRENPNSKFQIRPNNIKYLQTKRSTISGSEQGVKNCDDFRGNNNEGGRVINSPLQDED
jgi:hypothetical protein